MAEAEKNAAAWAVYQKWTKPVLLERLEAALRSREGQLTEEERRRNAPGQVELLLSAFHPSCAAVLGGSRRRR